MITSTIKGNIVIASLSENKKLNVLNAEEIKNSLTALLRDHNRLILDLEKITFIDSTGFGTLITIFKRAQENEKIFKICNVSHEAMALIKITKLDKIFEIHDNLENCLSSFN